MFRLVNDTFANETKQYDINKTDKSHRDCILRLNVILFRRYLFMAWLLTFCVCASFLFKNFMCSNDCWFFFWSCVYWWVSFWFLLLLECVKYQTSHEFNELSTLKCNRREKKAKQIHTIRRRTHTTTTKPKHFYVYKLSLVLNLHFFYVRYTDEIYFIVYVYCILISSIKWIQ